MLFLRGGRKTSQHLQSYICISQSKRLVKLKLQASSQDLAWSCWMTKTDRDPALLQRISQHQAHLVL